MSESSGGRDGADEVSDDAYDWFDAFVPSVMPCMVENVPHARLSAVEFSLGGVLWKTVLYGLAYVAGFACGWFFLSDDSQDRVRALMSYTFLLALFLVFAVASSVGRYEYGKGCPGPWFVALSFSFAPVLGIIFGSLGCDSDGVFRWVFVSVAVLVAVGVLVFPLVIRLVHNGFLSWAAMVVLCVVPSWMPARVTGSAVASLFWCCVVGVVGALWFVLDMRAIEECTNTHRDAAFEWLAAWALVFDLTLMIASFMGFIGDSNALMGTYKDDDDADR